ncbi:hypothetical protein BCV70DRAFT_198204 [Testicularia cyperi]|uniref:rRNA-processing protein FYV7 n=1 Tax=Testicularia cyperi TaxID=1882483 RepID=A0A317XVK8_9BASI|nr:hypothetical protein BCV70DRAFT_198204 [Testicularia cyperi]
MVAPKLTQRQLVKHRTATSGVEKKGGGFQVGPKHLPGGAYLGKQKRIKAELIHKAKVKKEYFKQLKKSTGPKDSATSSNTTPLGSRGQQSEAEGEHSQSNRPARAQDQDQDRPALPFTLPSDQGRFAPENADADDPTSNPDGLDAALSFEKKDLRPKKQKKKTQRPLPHPLPRSTTSAPTATQTSQDTRSKEQKLQDRQRKTQLWNTPSGSKTGQKRGQPNLNARMEVMLDKIRRSE